LNIVLREWDCVDNEIDFDASADSVIEGVANAIAIARIANTGEFCVAYNIMIQILYRKYLTFLLSSTFIAVIIYFIGHKIKKNLH
jgi:hypothetical protein